VIQIRNTMHRVRIFERATVVLRVVLRAIVTRENEPVVSRFSSETIVDSVDHVRPD
jgi:hypothetical protein